jgi:hypothetical protein
MNHSNYLTNNHSGKFIIIRLLFIYFYIGPVDYHHYSVQYRPQSSFIYPHEQMVNVNRINVNESFRPRSLTRVSESSSGIDSVDRESTETHSSNSEPLVIRYHSPSSSSSASSSCSRRVVINSTDQTVTISNKPRRRRRNSSKKGKKFPFEKNSIYKNQSLEYSSKYKQHNSSSERWEHKEDRLKRLFDKYSSENIHREWKPLTFLESRELYQYASDKHNKKSRFN